MLDLDTIGYFLFMEEQERQEQESQEEQKQEDDGEAEKGFPILPFL